MVRGLGSVAVAKEVTDDREAMSTDTKKESDKRENMNGIFWTK